jgi:hypothetical protein
VASVPTTRLAQQDRGPDEPGTRVSFVGWGCHTLTLGGVRMIAPDSRLVVLLRLVDRIPMPAPEHYGRGRPPRYSDRLFLKALVVMESGKSVGG